MVSVIIPAFNEEQTISQVVKAVHSLPIEKQIIVVNDGSTDGTHKVLEELRATYELTVIHCQENRGKGFAIRSGLPYVNGEMVVIQDADMELAPADLSELVKPLEKENVQVVYGSRFLNGRGNASLHNFIANRILATYTNILYGCRITDESTGYKAFSTELITRLDLTCEGFEFCPEVTAKILRAGYRIYEVPVSYFPTHEKGGQETPILVGWIFCRMDTSKISFYFRNRTF